MSTTPTFAELGVSKPVVSELAARGVERAFPIQAATIEAALAGRDICGKAPTGSGKTLAFGIPAVELSIQARSKRPNTLILSPTRELASQIKEEIDELARSRQLKVLTVFGGTNVVRDEKQLEAGVDILVACPGRLEDLISRGACDLGEVELVVVDEADRMADMGFLPVVKRILDQTRDDRHTLLFSATLDGEVSELIDRYQHDPLMVEVEDEQFLPGDVQHLWFQVESKGRLDLAAKILKPYYSAIVFCRTRRGCDRVAKMLAKRGLAAAAIHGDRSQNQRERALREFTEGKAQVLVATDVAARGIHVDNVGLVLHYDLAGTDKDYVHRSGRTGRAGADGLVITLALRDKAKEARQIQKALGFKPGYDELDLDNLPAAPDPGDRPARKASPRKDRPQGKQSQGSGRGRSGQSNRSKGKSKSSRGGQSKSSGGGKSKSSHGGQSKSSGGGKSKPARGRSDDHSSDGRSKDSRSSDGRSEGSRSKSSRSEGSRSKGSGSRGSRSKGRGSRDSRSEGSRSKDSGSRDSRSEGSRSEGSRSKDSRSNESRSNDSRSKSSRSHDGTSSARNKQKSKSSRGQAAKAGGAGKASGEKSGERSGSASKGGSGKSAPNWNPPKKRKASKNRWRDSDSNKQKGRRRPS